jgi:hypothetical protein
MGRQPEFDVGATILRLRDELARRGYARDDIEVDPLAAAITHMALHSTDGCVLEPCRGYGLAMAINELVVYGGQAAGGAALLEFSEKVDRFAELLLKEGKVLAPAARVFAEESRAKHHANAAGPNEALLHATNHDLFCVRPLRIVQQLRALALDVRGYGPALRSVLGHPALHRPKRRGRGRPNDDVLRAASQHLYRAGFSPAQISKLLPTEEVEARQVPSSGRGIAGGAPMFGASRTS